MVLDLIALNYIHAMPPSRTMSHLRFELVRAFAEQSQPFASVTPGLDHALSVVIRERLILLAKLDGAKRKDLPVSRLDADGTSDFSLDAVATWRSTLQDVFWHVLTRCDWRHQHFGLSNRGAQAARPG